MTSYYDASLVGTSRLSSVLGVWTKRTDIDLTISSDAIEVNARRESPPSNFSLPMRPPVIHTTYHDRQDALHFPEASRFSSETLCVPPPYSPKGYMCTGMEKHTGVSSDEEPPTMARMLFKYGFCKSLVALNLSYVFLPVNTSLLPILARRNLYPVFALAPNT